MENVITSRILVWKRSLHLISLRGGHKSSPSTEKATCYCLLAWKMSLNHITLYGKCLKVFLSSFLAWKSHLISYSSLEVSLYLVLSFENPLVFWPYMQDVDLKAKWRETSNEKYISLYIKELQPLSAFCDLLRVLQEKIKTSSPTNTCSNTNKEITVMFVQEEISIISPFLKCILRVTECSKSELTG